MSRSSSSRPTADGGQVHGGPHQALYVFPSEHYPRLEALLGRHLDRGFMGENLTVIGGTERDVCIGDRWRWGDAPSRSPLQGARATSSASGWDGKRVVQMKPALRGVRGYRCGFHNAVELM